MIEELGHEKNAQVISNWVLWSVFPEHMVR
jgi:hypothetical protein